MAKFDFLTSFNCTWPRFASMMFLTRFQNTSFSSHVSYLSAVFKEVDNCVHIFVNEKMTHVYLVHILPVLSYCFQLRVRFIYSFY